MMEFEVTGLIPTFVYMFRVMAFNAQGEGEPLESKVPMMAKNAMDPPDPPSNVRITDYDKKWVSLAWFAPSGQNTKHFIIEMQETFLVPKDAPEAEEDEAGEEQVQKSEQEEAMQPTNKALAEAMARANAGPAFTGEFEEFCSTWIVAMITDDDECEAKVKDLAEGHTYR